MKARGQKMDSARFQSLAEAFGADCGRWPASDREAAAAYTLEHPEQANAILLEARKIDAALDLTRADVGDLSLLTARILSSAKKANRPVFDYRAALAMAACAVFGVLIGYGGGMLAPPSDVDEFYFASAFEAPTLEDEG